MSQAEIKDKLPKPRSYTYQEYVAEKTQGMNREEVLESEVLWAKARDLAAEKDQPLSEAFSELANHAFSENGVNAYISPEAAKKFIVQERLKYGLSPFVSK